jgi:galactokinase
MNAGDALEMGLLINASHISMRDDFEITNDELNIMVQLAQTQPGCFGARMTGGGFGGCALALVQESLANLFIDKVHAQYLSATGLVPNIFICNASNGAENFQTH